MRERIAHFRQRQRSNYFSPRVVCMKEVKGLGLFSGGLDSILAAKVLMEQGIAVTGISFASLFFSAEQARSAADAIGLPLITRDISLPQLALVKNPPHGYGSNMNPCIDCHALMLAEAGKIMEAEGYDFLFTGEVLNERPMSQTRNSLIQVAKLSGYKEYVLRPLSAKLLAETAAEKRGLVDRTRLLDIQGRSRKRQLALAAQYDITQFPAPAGGCLLTDPNFAKRLRELFEHNGECSHQEIELLKVGRHFRIDGIKVIVGRNRQENQIITALAAKHDTLLSAEHLPGPVVLVCGGGDRNVIEKAAGLGVRYSDARYSQPPPALEQIYPPGKQIIPCPMSEEVVESIKLTWEAKSTEQRSKE